MTRIFLLAIAVATTDVAAVDAPDYKTISSEAFDQLTASASLPVLLKIVHDTVQAERLDLLARLLQGSDDERYSYVSGWIDGQMENQYAGGGVLPPDRKPIPWPAGPYRDAVTLMLLEYQRDEIDYWVNPVKADHSNDQVIGRDREILDRYLHLDSGITYKQLSRREDRLAIVAKIRAGSFSVQLVRSR